jgi:hypothetical protein
MLAVVFCAEGQIFFIALVLPVSYCKLLQGSLSFVTQYILRINIGR